MVTELSHRLTTTGQKVSTFLLVSVGCWCPWLKAALGDSSRVASAALQDEFPLLREGLEAQREKCRDVFQVLSHLDETWPTNAAYASKKLCSPGQAALTSRFPLLEEMMSLWPLMLFGVEKRYPIAKLTSVALNQQDVNVSVLCS